MYSKIYEYVAYFGFAALSVNTINSVQGNAKPIDSSIYNLYNLSADVPEPKFNCEEFVQRFTARYEDLDYSEELFECESSKITRHLTEAEAVSKSIACKADISWTVEDNGSWLTFCRK